MAAPGRKRVASALLSPAALWVVAFFVVPLGLLAILSFGSTDVVGRPLITWNPSNYAGLFQSAYISVLVRTLVFAAVVVVTCLILGYLVAYTIVVYGGRRRDLLIALVMLPWFVNYLVRIYAWLELLQSEGIINQALKRVGIIDGAGIELDGHAISVIIGLVYNFLPLMIITIYASLEGLDWSLIEAARDLYATERVAFLRVTVPLTARGAGFGCVLTFLLTLGDFATAQFLGGPNTFMLGNLIQLQFTGVGAIPQGSALTMVLLALITCAMALVAVARVANARWTRMHA